MKFKIDQNLAVECAALLVEAGHDAMTVYQQELTGAPDERILRRGTIQRGRWVNSKPEG